MSSESFTISKRALITLIAASIVVIISLGIRQTFGLFYFDFNTDLDISISHFGFVMGLQLLLWGVFSPLFGVITCLLYTSPSPRDRSLSRMPSSA